MLYLRMLKLLVQKHMDSRSETVSFLLNIQTIAYDFCKSVAIDASMLKYKPSVLGAAFIFLGFQLEFEIL